MTFPKSICHTTLSEKYDTLQKAYAECSSNVNCIGIKDGNCDFKGEFELCIGGIQRKDRVNVCVHKKQDSYGEY